MADRRSSPDLLERFASRVSDWSGRSAAFLAALGLTLAWGALGPLFHFSDSWQLVINTATNVGTFLMAFLIQRAQNKDSLAIQLKLNELLAAVRGTRKRVIAVDELSEEELRRLHRHYLRLAEYKARRRRSAESGNSSSSTP